jgi:HAD superfamily hydrolase (TIGR01509 family)
MYLRADLEPQAHTVPASPAAPELKAALWDMDGTLVDTEPYWIAAEIELVTSHGGHWDEQLATSMVGNALETSAEIFQGMGVRLSVREIVDQLSNSVIASVRRKLPWRPGARELLAELDGRGVRCALVTMSERPLAQEIVNALDAPYFEFMVTGDQVARGKPHPEPYLTAIDLLREADPTLTAGHCVALEDSIPGVASAMAANVATIAIPHVVQLPADARRTMWGTLAGRTYDDVAAVLAARGGPAGGSL